MRSPSSRWAHRFLPWTQIWKLPQEAPVSWSMPRPSSGSEANFNAKTLVSPASLSHRVVMAC